MPLQSSRPVSTSYACRLRSGVAPRSGLTSPANEPRGTCQRIPPVLRSTAATVPNGGGVHGSLDGASRSRQGSSSCTIEAMRFTGTIGVVDAPDLIGREGMWTERGRRHCERLRSGGLFARSVAPSLAPAGTRCRSPRDRDGLSERPDDLAGRGSQRDERVGVAVVAKTERPVVSFTTRGGDVIEYAAVGLAVAKRRSASPVR